MSESFTKRKRGRALGTASKPLADAPILGSRVQFHATKMRSPDRILKSA